VTDIPSCQNEDNALQNPVLERVLLRMKEVAGLVVEVDLVVEVWGGKG
jgi:hypothetical protein